MKVNKTEVNTVDCEVPITEFEFDSMEKWFEYLEEYYEKSLRGSYNERTKSVRIEGDVGCDIWKVV